MVIFVMLGAVMASTGPPVSSHSVAVIALIFTPWVLMAVSATRSKIRLMLSVDAGVASEVLISIRWASATSSRVSEFTMPTAEKLPIRSVVLAVKLLSGPSMVMFWICTSPPVEVIETVEVLVAPMTSRRAMMLKSSMSGTTWT